MLADETYHEDALSTTEIGRSLGTDYFGLRDELTDAERDYLRRTRAFVDNDVLPVINGYWERAQFPWPLIKKMGTLGIVGDAIEGYGCPAMATAPEAATPEVDPQQVIDQVFDCAEKMLAVQREFAKSLATAGSATEAARQQSESVVGVVRQQAEETTKAIREQPRPTNNFKGQDQRTDMRFSPIPTHLFEHESRTQA